MFKSKRYHISSFASALCLTLVVAISLAMPVHALEVDEGTGTGGGAVTPVQFKELSIPDRSYVFEAFNFMNYDDPHTCGRQWVDGVGGIGAEEAAVWSFLNDASGATRPGLLLGAETLCSNSTWMRNAWSMLGYTSGGSVLSGIKYTKVTLDSGEVNYIYYTTEDSDAPEGAYRNTALPKDGVWQLFRERHGGVPQLDDLMKYYIYLSAFTNPLGCNAKQVGLYNPTDDVLNTRLANEKDTLYRIWVYDGTSDSVNEYVYEGIGRGKDIVTGYGLIPGQPNEFQQNCDRISSQLSGTSGQTLAANFANTVRTDPSQANSSVAEYNSVLQQLEDSCPLPPDASLRWLGCAVFSGLKGIADSATGHINTFLYSDPVKLFNETASKAATSFRNLGLALIVIAGIAMVIAQASGSELFDAYTIRKLLPRLGIAMIGMVLSWPLLRFAVVLANDLGGLIDNLFMGMVSAAGAGGASVGTGSNLLGMLSAIMVGGGVFIALGVLGGLSLVATVVLAILIALLVLSVRQLVIFMCIILAPLAIAAYVLPGTQKLWAFWKNTFITTLVMYPLIMGFIAGGKAMSYLLMGENQIKAVNAGGGFSGDANMSLLAILVYFAPFFLLPFAFKMAGGLMSTIFSLANDKNRGLFDRLKGVRSNQRKKNWQNIQEGKRWQGNPLGERLSHSLQTGSLLATGKGGVNVFNPKKMRGRIQSARSAIDTARSHEAAKDPAVAAALSDDYMIDAALHGERNYASALKYFRDHGDDEETARMRAGVIENGRRAVGRAAFEEAAVAANAGTKTGFSGGRSQLNEMVNRVAGKDDVKRARLMAAAREAAKSAQRVDLYGGSYGDSVDIAKLQQEDLTREQRQRIIDDATAKDPNSILAGLRADQRLTPELVNQLSSRSVLRNNNIYEIAGGYYIGTQNMVEGIGAELGESQNALQAAITAGGDNPTAGQQAAINQAREVYVRSLAHFNTLTAVAGQTNERNAEIIGGIMGQSQMIMPTQEVVVTEEITVTGPDGRPMIDSSTNQPLVERKQSKITVEIGSKEWREHAGTVESGTLRDATFNAEMGSATYHQYAQSYYKAQQQAGASAATAAAQAAAQAAAAGGHLPPGSMNPFGP